jgi:UDP-N-acetylglucosamine 2-epimerase (non-hydrolysing)
MKIAIIIGTRPEIIKMAPVIDEIEKRGIEYILVHTGQHYDHEMSHQFFVDLELKKPDFNIGVGSGSHGKQTARMMEKIEDVLVAEKPDIVLVQGDTNAVLAGALAASKLHIAVGHVEAGLRSYDKTMPEEINRQVADVASNLYFVPTEESALNLIFEGLDPHEIFVTGNTVVDACIRNLKIAQKSSTVLSDLDVQGDILTLTMHRAENVDDPERLQEVTDALLELENITVVFPVHPRTVKTLKKFGIYEKLENAPHVLMTKPIGYLDFLVLLSNSRFIMTDSGGLQEEAITLNVPCLTLRYNTERPETVTAGGNILVGSSKEKILENLRRIAGDESAYQEMSDAVNPYGDGKASEKILDAILDASDSGKLQITAPEYIMSHAGRELLQISEDITVSEFEDKNSGSTINIVFNGGEAQFPVPDLDLKDKQVLVNRFDIK